MAAVSDGNGAVADTFAYDPYGRVTSSTGSVANPWQFGGRYGAYADGTGLLKIGQRYDDPSLGRWTQPDPVPHLADPGQQDRYVYAANSPCSFTDPTGTSCGFYTTLGLGALALAGFIGVAASPLLLPAGPWATAAGLTIAGLTFIGATWAFYGCLTGE